MNSSNQLNTTSNSSTMTPSNEASDRSGTSDVLGQSLGRSMMFSNPTSSRVDSGEADEASPEAVAGDASSEAAGGDEPSLMLSAGRQVRVGGSTTPAPSQPPPQEAEKEEEEEKREPVRTFLWEGEFFLRLGIFIFSLNATLRRRVRTQPQLLWSQQVITYLVENLGRKMTRDNNFCVCNSRGGVKW